jgi:ferric-dicitrate binding protein FerR (iron transport regulator)
VGAVAETRLSTVVAFDHIDDWLDTLPETLPLDIVRVGPVVWARERGSPAARPVEASR